MEVIQLQSVLLQRLEGSGMSSMRITFSFISFLNYADLIPSYARPFHPSLIMQTDPVSYVVFDLSVARSGVYNGQLVLYHSQLSPPL